MDSVWFDGEGNEMEYPPDIQPYDFVYAEVPDNGVYAQVQIGEIHGRVSYQTDSITGSIDSQWIPDLVSVECLDWGSGEDPPYSNKDGGSILTDGSDPYYCSWAGEWDIQPYQDVGVGYFGLDGHWVANAFTTPFPRIVASEAGDWFWVTEFYPGFLDVFIYESDEVGAAELWYSDQQEVTDLWGITSIGFDIHGKDLQPGNYLVVSDGVNEKGLVLEPITIHTFNTLDDFIAGTAPLDRDVLVGAGPDYYQETIWVTADEEIPGNPDTGGWVAYFDGIIDITEVMRTWSWAQIFDEDWDANEGSNPPTPEIRAWVASNRVEGYRWPQGSEITLYINDFENPIDSQIVTENEWGTYISFDLNGWALQPGQEIWMVGGGTEKLHTVLPVSITEVNSEDNIVYGTSSLGGYIILCIYNGGCDPPAEIPDENEDGYWIMEFGEIFDILPGFGMDATEFDEDGDGTSFEYWVP
jgi:hypothetical protein